MQMSIVSSLTPEDERRCAAAFFKTICTVLDLLPVAYSVRVTTASGKPLTRTHSPNEAGEDHSHDLADTAPPIAPDTPPVGEKPNPGSR